MSTEIDTAIATTQRAFLKGVWPEVASVIGGGQIIPVEAVSDKEFLDKHSGIDHWHVLDRHSLIRGIASRCQWPIRKHFQSFTLRIGRKNIAKTELAKRLYAMENASKGWIRPHLFIQAFFGPPWGSYESFLYAGIAKMDDILTIVRDGMQGKYADWYEDVTSQKYGQKDAKRFAVIPFSTVQRYGFQFILCDRRKSVASDK